MSPRDTSDNRELWATDESLPDSPATDFHLYESQRTGGKYRIDFRAARYFKSLCRNMGDLEVERSKARLATVLVDRLKQGEVIPVVDITLVDYVCEKAKDLPVAKRARRLLHFVVGSTGSIGDSIDLSQPSIQERTLGSSESTKIEEVVYLFEYLMEAGFIDRISASGYYRATVQGFESVEQENASPEASVKAFVALWFDESTKGLRSAIEEAILQSGYEPFIVDDETFDGLIDDAITAGIRTAKFVVADLTHGEAGMRGSVYYEAGLARGQEKTVILTAHGDHIADRTIAFDLNHYPIIKWTEEDLPNFTKELNARIEALFGRGPGV